MQEDNLYQKGFLSAFREDEKDYDMKRADFLAMINQTSYIKGRISGLKAQQSLKNYVVKDVPKTDGKQRKLKLDEGTINDIIKYHELYNQSCTPVEFINSDKITDFLNTVAHNLNYLNLGVKMKEAEHLAIEHVTKGVSMDDFFRVKGSYYFTYKQGDSKGRKGYTLYKKEGIIVLRLSGTLKTGLTLEEVASAGYRPDMFTRELASYSITYYDHTIKGGA